MSGSSRPSIVSRNTLMLEVDGILNWCIEGYKRYLAEGLELPEAVIQATKEFRAQSVSEESTVGRFLQDCCELDPLRKEGLKSIYYAFSNWCNDNAEVCISDKHLSKILIEEHKLVKNRSMADGSTAICGIRLFNNGSSDQSMEEANCHSRLTLVPATKVA